MHFWFKLRIARISRMRVAIGVYTAKKDKIPLRAIREIRSLSLFPSAVSDSTERKTQVPKHLA